MNDEQLIFVDEATDANSAADGSDAWVILIVDDDKDVHEATVFTLRGSVLLGRPLTFLHAYSGNEAVEVLKSHPDVALILLDAVMETEDAGLSTVQVIREEMGLDHVRIILRTGQPGQVPELDTITKYDINDYKTKSELNRTKLLTAIISALRSWQQIQKIEVSRRGLHKIVEASNAFIVEQGLQSFAEGVITQMAGLFGLEPEGVVCASGKCRSGNETPCCRVIAAAGRFSGLINHTVTEIEADIENPAILSSIHTALENKENVIGSDSITIYFADPSGNSYATWVGSPQPLRDIDHHLLEIFCTNISLCAGNIELVSRLKRKAWEDPLLGIPNMVALLDAMQHQIDGEAPSREFLAILDIDGFSQINDLLGHDYGDTVLKRVSDRMHAVLGDKVLIARVTSDVFAVLGDGADFPPEVLQSLSAMRVASADGERELSISIGLTRVDPDEGNASVQLRNAIVALKRAKSEGVGQVVHYSTEIGEETRERIRLLQQLRGAFAEDKLFLMFQPQITIPDRKPFSCEALLRWKNDDGQFIPPDRFIPLAEQAGLIVPIGLWVFRMSLFALKHIHASGFPDMRMAVNVSAMQLRRKDFLAQLETAVQEIGVDPHMVELEITESISAIGIKDTLKLLHAIRDMGFSIAVDDFGTGYSSLSSIDQWPVNRLKIDRSFIQNMEQREKGARLVDLVIPLGNRLSMDVLAEGVETEMQLERLGALGCREAQGFLISKPLELNDFISWLQSRPQS